MAAGKHGPPDLAIILGHKPPADDVGEDDHEEGGEGYEAKSDAMDAFIKAVKEGDTKAACEAFDALHDLKANEEGDEGEEHDDEEE